MRSDLEIPSTLGKLFSLYLLMAIGLKEGFALQHSPGGGEVFGKGSSGFKGGDLPVDIGRNWYVLIACDPERVEKIVSAFRPVITKYGGVCLVTDAQMLKKSAFEEDTD